MKQLFILAFILFVAVACKKETIVNNHNYYKSPERLQFDGSLRQVDSQFILPDSIKPFKRR